MTNGIPAYRPSQFPNDEPPTLFGPADKKVKANKPTRDAEAMSMNSTATFGSTVSLLKSKVSQKLNKTREWVTEKR